MIVSFYTIQAEGLGLFLKKLSKKGLNASKGMAKKVSRNPGRALDNTANVAGAVVSRNPKSVSSTFPEVINFYHTGK